MSSRKPIELPDPRPRLVEHDSQVKVDGFACTKCGFPSAVPGPWCPKCQSDLEPRLFGPRGRVWSSTVFRVRLQDRTPPWTLVWVDVEEGPRVLAHMADSTERVPIGTTVEFVGTSEHGDLLVSRFHDNQEGDDL